MNVFILLFLIFIVPLIALLGKRNVQSRKTVVNLTPAWLALSSCLGDGFRAQISGTRVHPRHGVYGRSYARGMASFAPAGSEQIEMEDVMTKDWNEDDADADEDDHS